MQEKEGARGLLYGTVNKALRRGTFPSHRHPMAELYVCLGGSAVDLLDGRERYVLPGDVFVHTAEGLHTQRELTEFRCLVFQFRLELLTERAAALGIGESEGFCALFLGEGDGLYVDPDTLRLVEHLGDRLRATEDTAMAEALFLSLVTVLSAACRRRSGPANETDTVGLLIAHIDAHYAEELSLPALASLTHYSGRHVSRLFRARVGLSPMAYLDAVRMAAAADLLTRTREDIAAIGRACGFPDNSLFSRHFRLRYHLSPGEYRRRHSTRGKAQE